MRRVTRLTTLFCRSLESEVVALEKVAASSFEDGTSTMSVNVGTIAGGLAMRLIVG